jgi:15-cis-phytoene synthase/lycopene beta-cyclase
MDARKMGRALQLVNIARDVAKDAAIGRLYIPLSAFASPNDILDILLYPPTSPASTAEPEAKEHVGKVYARYNLPLLDLADELRSESEDAIARLPRTARGGMRAMVASYFEIAVAVRREKGRVDERGVRVSKAKRAYEAALGLWLGEGLLSAAF